MNDVDAQQANKCVLCDQAWATPGPFGEVLWVVTFATPSCDHETIDGRK